jgi:hypothetical protein
MSSCVVFVFVFVSDFCSLWYVRVAEGLVCCTGTLRSTLLFCCEVHEVCPHCSLVLVLQFCFRCVFLLVNLLKKVIIVYSCRGNGFSVVITAVCAAVHHTNF